MADQQRTCSCGQVLAVPGEAASQAVTCPACGEVVPAPVQQLNYAGGGTMPDGPIAPPPGQWVRGPTVVSDKFRSPGMPPCYLVLDTRGADVNAQFDVSPALNTLADALAKKVRKKHDVQIVPAAPPGAPAAVVRLIQIDEGNRFLRYFLTFFAGKTVFEVEGEVRTASGASLPFHHRHKGTAGLFGGDAINLLKASAKVVGTKIGKALLK